MKPTRYDRNDLLEDTRFWVLLYEQWVKPRVGDGFDDGEEHFFSVGENAVDAFFRDLENHRVPPGSYPEHAVLLSLRNGWRIGVVLSIYPEDFAIHDVVVPMSSDEPIAFDVNGGNFQLPALRWEELLLLQTAAVPNTPANRAKALLLLFPSIYLSSEMRIDEVRQVVEQAWTNSGIPITRARELVDRPINDFVESRRRHPEVQETIWRKHESLGWINDGCHSLRNPAVADSDRVIPVMRELLSAVDPN